MILITQQWINNTLIPFNEIDYKIYIEVQCIRFSNFYLVEFSEYDSWGNKNINFSLWDSLASIIHLLHVFSHDSQLPFPFLAVVISFWENEWIKEVSWLTGTRVWKLHFLTPQPSLSQSVSWNTEGTDTIDGSMSDIRRESLGLESGYHSFHYTFCENY